nr:hypothetical protein [Tanacetum cinerariifolium]
VHVKMEIEIPRSIKVKFITSCSYPINEYDDMIKARIRSDSYVGNPVNEILLNLNLPDHRRFDSYVGNPIKEILLNLNLPDHRSVLMEPKVHVKMEMEIPRSIKVKFITSCSYSVNEYDDMIKARMYVIQDFCYIDTQKVFLEVIMYSR